MKPSEMCECLTGNFAENFMEKLFYFCLKKTGHNTEAENLTQDIALSVLTELNKGIVPDNFSAWVWKIARNRYSVWADKKHKRSEVLSDMDICDYEIEAEGENPVERVIENEQISFLRRELAFIKRNYREIIVSYYIEDKSLADISKRLSLPAETVKKRLQRARKILKEGMEMAREFGTRSYKPENVTFAASGPQPSGLPWNLVQRSIPKNILLQASNNPSTAEELAVELGIALPYMEEEIEILYQGTLLEKCGDKYITNFVILDKESRLEIYNILRKGSAERSRAIREMIEEYLPEFRKLFVNADNISDCMIKWWLVPHIIDRYIDEIGKIYPNKPPKRANGEKWGFVGYETVSLPENIVMGHNGMDPPEAAFWAYKYGDYGLWEQCGEMWDRNQPIFLAQCIKNKRNVGSFSAAENELWKQIKGRHAHSDENGNIVPDILVIEGEGWNTLTEIIKNHKNHESLLENCMSATKQMEKVFKKSNNKLLHSQIGYNIMMELCAMRMMAVHDLVEAGFLKLPENPKKSTLGMALILNHRIKFI
ncbi:MAG: sigma-70 family RNA polymerase sigma factor [Clostridia bacterium]|nr:sigma-70 family RNA polymerase sigma factor [Clostridia bacterium]